MVFAKTAQANVIAECACKRASVCVRVRVVCVYSCHHTVCAYCVLFAEWLLLSCGDLSAGDNLESAKSP